MSEEKIEKNKMDEGFGCCSFALWCLQKIAMCNGNVVVTRHTIMFVFELGYV